MRSSQPEPPELSDEQRLRLLNLLGEELRQGYQAALAAGADPNELAVELDRRRSALAAGLNRVDEATAPGDDAEVTGQDERSGPVP